MVHTPHNRILNLNLDFEIQQYFGSLKHMINIVIWIRDTWSYTYCKGTVHTSNFDPTTSTYKITNYVLDDRSNEFIQFFTISATTSNSNLGK
jgi:hypothetical protein